MYLAAAAEYIIGLETRDGAFSDVVGLRLRTTVERDTKAQVGAGNCSVVLKQVLLTGDGAPARRFRPAHAPSA